MSRTRPLFWFSTLPALALHAPFAYAAHYLDIDEAQRLLFPNAEQFTVVNTATESAGNPPLRIWKATGKTGLIGYFVVDEVIGKHEYITYSVALSAHGVVQRIEILEYRETKGWQVANQAWREQFKHKTARDKLEVGEDISNISGATLSCKHVTEGVRKILSFYESQLKVSA